jgi:hypothetical protein
VTCPLAADARPRWFVGLWEEREEESRETYYDLTDDQFALLAQAVEESGGAMKIVAHTVYSAGDAPEKSEATN